MTDQSRSRQRFFDSLGQRLQQMPPEQLRASVLRYAQGLHSPQRDRFLTSLIVDDETERVHDPTDLTWPIESDPLLTEIDNFVARLESADYVDDGDWGDDPYDDWSEGHDSWVWEFNGFFTQADEAFLAGRLGLARAAYQRLFDAFSRTEDIETSWGYEPAVAMLDTDLAEAQARYLRAVYETTSATERAPVLAESWFGLPDEDAEVSLATVREARRRDLPEFGQFLSAWVSTLRSLEYSSPPVRQLLTEATLLFDGVDGLGDLARETRHDQAEHYLQWVQALRRERRESEAIDAANEALSVLGEGPVKALIAEELADLVYDDAAQVVAARRNAWRAAPNQSRLLALHEASTHTSEATEVMAAELKVLESADRFDGGLHAALAILAGRVDDIVQVLEQNQPQRSARDVLVPYLLASGCSGPQHPAWSSTRLAQFITTVDRQALWDGFATFGLVTGTPDHTPPLSELFIRQIQQQRVTNDVLSKRLTAAIVAIEHEVDSIVSNKQRRQYASAAQLLVCCAEAFMLANHTVQGRDFIRNWKTRYPRHIAFQREFDGAIEKASLLNSATA